MKNKYPIYIPSKQRDNHCLTAKELGFYNIDYKIVVEPQDYKLYGAVYSEKNLLLLDKNDMGLGYSRAFIKKYAEKNNEKYHWQMDDDLLFYKRVNNKNIKFSIEKMIEEIESFVDCYSNIGIAALRNMVFAFSLKNELSLNNQCCSCFLVKSNMKSQYAMDIIEDTDFSMQVLTEGFCTVIFNKLLYKNPPVNANKGGCSDGNQYDRVAEFHSNLVGKWPNAFNIGLTKDGKSTRIKPSRVWSGFKTKLIPNGKF